MILDSQQLLLEKKLQQLAFDLEHQSSSGFLKKFFSEKKQLKSVYIYGDVGRGKSMLMKNFFNSLQEIPKVYFHFNAFMRLIHEALRDIRKEKREFVDELIEAVKRVAKNYELICLDEFQVADIADAMLLSRIFSHLFFEGIVVIFTSNSHPQKLYKNGLQREIFLEFVDKILLKNCDTFHLDLPVDYRSQYRKNLTKRYFISNKKNREEVEKIIQNLVSADKPKSKKLKVWGREIKIKKTFGRVAVFNFDELCCVDFSASDYQAICQNFDLIFLLKTPSLTPENVNEAKRFMLLIDEVYENKVALIILAKVKPEKLYQNGNGSEAFLRTVSRLNEIRSDHYWQASKINF
jgi:cell division protein ZapE